MSNPTSVLPDNAFLLWLQDEANNEYLTPQSLTQMYTHLAPQADDPLDVFKADDRTHSFLVFLKQRNTNQSRSHLLHHMSMLPPRVGQPAQHAGRYFLSSGDSIHNQFVTHELPADFLTTLAPQYSFTADRIQRAIGHAPDEVQVAVDTEDEANLEDLELLTTRRSMWIPNQYAALVLDTGLSPVAVWNRLYSQLLQDGNTVSCEPLLTFLRANIIGDHINNGAIFDETFDLFIPPVDAPLMRNRAAVLQHLAPPTTMPATAPAPAPSTDPLLIQQLVMAMRSHAAPAPVVPSNATNMDKRWPTGLDTLQKFAHTTSVADLPKLWQSLAAGPRKSERAIIQSALDEYARSPAAATSVTLVVNKDLVETLVNFRFWSGDIDRLDEGLHPFRSVYTSTAKSSQDQSHLQTYDFLASDGSLRSADIHLFRHVLKSNWPSDFLQLDVTLKLFSNLLHICWNPSHPLNVAYDAFLKSWSSIAIQLSELFKRSPPMAAQFLRSVQLQLGVYFQSVDTMNSAEARLVPPPNFVDLLVSIRVQSWVPPIMPQVPALPIAPVPAAPSAGPPLPRVPTAAAPPSAQAPAPAVPAERIVNPAVNPEIKAAMEGRTFQIRDLFSATVRPPTTSSGQPICCSYHLRGFCFANCRRSNTHLPLSDSETAKLCQFVQTYVVVPNVGRAT